MTISNSYKTDSIVKTIRLFAPATHQAGLSMNICCLSSSTAVSAAGEWQKEHGKNKWNYHSLPPFSTRPRKPNAEGRATRRLGVWEVRKKTKQAGQIGSSTQPCIFTRCSHSLLATHAGECKRKDRVINRKCSASESEEQKQNRRRSGSKCVECVPWDTFL